MLSFSLRSLFCFAPHAIDTFVFPFLITLVIIASVLRSDRCGQEADSLLRFCRDPFMDDIEPGIARRMRDS